MIRVLLVDAIACTTECNGKCRLTLDRSQMEELYKDITAALRIDAVAARTYFFDKEGYMETDSVCIEYWLANHD